MEYVVQKAIEYGFPPIIAIQMATLNPAQHHGLDAYIGGLAPGRQADIVVIPNIQTIQPRIVISKGRIVAKDGKLLARPRKPVYSRESQNTVKLPRPITAQDFKIPAPTNKEYANIRVIDLVTRLVTHEKHISIPVKNNQILADPEAGILKIAAIDRTIAPGQCFTGLIRGFGFHAGAIASSAAWDTTDIIVVGAEDLDMAKAVNRVIEMNGGHALSVDGRIKEEVPLPIFGLISQAPFSQLTKSMEKMTKASRELGFPYDAPLLTLTTLTCQAIPFLRICEEGLVNLKDGETVGLFLDAI
jgi:adenine deaminase